MKDPKANPLDRKAAARALGMIGPAAADAIPDLIGLILDEKLDVNESAIRALGEIGPAAKDAVEPLIKAVKADRFGRYDGKAIAAAGALGRPGTVTERAEPSDPGHLEDRGFPGACRETFGRARWPGRRPGHDE